MLIRLATCCALAFAASGATAQPLPPGQSQPSPPSVAMANPASVNCKIGRAHV